MIRYGIVLTVLSFVLPFGLQADLTIKGTNYTAPWAGGTAIVPSQKKDVQDYTIYVQGHNMRMDNGGAYTVIIREQGPGLEYVLVDHSKKQYYSIKSTEAASSEVQTVTRSDQEITGANLNGSIHPKPIQGHAVKAADFSYRGKATPPVGMPPQYQNMITVNVEIKGTSFVAPGMQGADELAAFYQNMQAKLASAQQASGVQSVSPLLSRGMTTIMARVAGFGFPLVTMQNTKMTMTMQGMPGPAAGMVRSMLSKLPGMSSMDPNNVAVSEVQSVTYDALGGALFYNGGYPSGYKAKEIKEFKGLPPPGSR